MTRTILPPACLEALVHAEHWLTAARREPARFGALCGLAIGHIAQAVELERATAPTVPAAPERPRDHTRRMDSEELRRTAAEAELFELYGPGGRR